MASKALTKQATALTKQERHEWHFRRGNVQRKNEAVRGWLDDLWIIKTQRLWREDFASWEDYVETDLGKSRSYVHRLFRQQAARRKDAGQDELPGMPERHSRALEKLPDLDTRREAYAEATRAADGEQPELPHVEQAVARRLGQDVGEVKLTDGLGLRVDEKFRDVFIAAARFNSLSRSIASIKGEIEAIIKTPAGAVLETQRQSIDRDRKNMLRALKFAKPYASCPYCGGAGRKDCKACDGRGWVTKEVFDTSPAGTN